MKDRRILIADSNETSRTHIDQLLRRKGFRTYTASDGAGAIRIARTVFPDLALIDSDLWGISAFDAADIIESDGLSTAVLMTSRLSQEFLGHLKKRRLYVYLRKPVQAEELYRTLAFALKTADQIHGYLDRIRQLEAAIENRRLIDEAKAHLMEAHGLTEEGAYSRLRRDSMDLCLPMHEAARRILTGRPSP